MIEVRNLTKRYGDVTAVDDLSFRVTPGQVTGFLGPNGAGKSTTMRAIMGLDRPDAGTTTVNGRPYRDLQRPLTEVGALLEAKALHPGRSAIEHLRFLAAANGLGRSRIDTVLDLVGLREVAGRRTGGYSLGMGQRLGIAAALLGDPPTLLFDEPVNGLDPEGIIWVRRLLKSLAAEGRTVLVSSHLMAEMALTADHLVVIGRGRLIADTTVSDIVSQASARQVVVRGSDAGRLTAALAAAGGTVTDDGDGTLLVTGLDPTTIGDRALADGIAVYELTPRRASLEEAFMTLTGGDVEFSGQLTTEPANAGAGSADQ